MFLADSQQIGRADQIMIEEKNVSGISLMETAGQKSADYLLEKFQKENHFLILCGPGNNGGDGLVIARILFQANKKVYLIYGTETKNYKGDAAANFNRLKGLGIQSEIYTSGIRQKLHRTWSENYVLVDALLGTGISASLRSPIAEIIDEFSEEKNPVVAIDLPSGLDANSGECLNKAIKSSCTLTFQLPKVCHYVTPAADYCGIVEVIDIGIYPEVINGLGIQRRLLDLDYVRENYLQRESNSHKGSFGHAMVVGGSRSMAGAIALAARSVLAIGAGLCTAFIPGSARCGLYAESLGVMNYSFGNDEQEFLNIEAIKKFQEKSADKSAIAIGPGLGKNEQTISFLTAVLPDISCPLVLDADALNILSENSEWWNLLPTQTVITPHPGEMARLLKVKNVQSRRLEYAEELAKERKVTVVLKGANTLVAFPDGETLVCSAGNAGMATAGSGDVLTGAITGLLAQGYAFKIAVCLGVFLHAYTGDRLAKEIGQEGVTAEGILGELSRSWKIIREEKAQIK